jgi:hypothetical protein
MPARRVLEVPFRDDIKNRIQKLLDGLLSASYDITAALVLGGASPPGIQIPMEVGS